MGTAAVKLICFDCDSTLSAVEGIDELARRRGPEVFARVERMTREAMEGSIRLEDVFRLRLELIQPTREEVAALGELYVEQVEPTARETIAGLRTRGWTPAIVSGGYAQAIAPLARFLDIGRVEAVPLRFAPDGRYAGVADHAAAVTGGKAALVQRLRTELQPEKTVLVGDGISDLEALSAVDVFVGFGRYARRTRVAAESHHFITALSELLTLFP